MVSSLVFLAAVVPTANTKVVVDSRVELLTTVFRLAGAWEFQMESSESEYSKRSDAYFAPYKEHPTIKLAAAVREKYGIGFDGVTGYAVYLKDTKSCDLQVPLSPLPPHWDKRWKPEVAVSFAQALKTFVTDSHFNEYMAQEQPYFEKAVSSLSGLFATYDVDTWCRDFFGKSPTHKPFAIIGMLCGGGNYGVSVEYPDGSLQMTPIFGASGFDKSGVPQYNDSDLPTVIHEFSHAYANPAATKHFEKLVPAAKKFMPRLSNVFAANAYGDPETVICESFTRMSEAYLSKKHLPAKYFPLILEWQRGTGFLWISELVAWAEEYEKNRSKYKTIDDYMPALADKFVKLSQNPEALYKRCPRVKSFKADWGKVTGDSQEVTLTLTFDQAMQTDKRGMMIEPEGATVVTPTAFAKDGKSLKIVFALKAGVSYKVNFNRDGRGYTSAKGYPVLPDSRTIKSP